MEELDVKLKYKRLKPGQKAFIYQQISEFAPFLLPDSDVEVLIEKNDEDDNYPNFLVELKLSGGGSFVKSVGRAESIYEAVKTAKNNLLAHLHSIQQKVISNDERKKTIEDIKKSGKVH